MNSEENLLKEYISLLISEERGKSHIGAGGASVGGAFKNVGTAATGLVKKLFSRGKTILKLSKELVVTTVLKPWAKAQYDKIMEEGRAEIKALKEKYKTPGLWEMLPPDMKVFAMFLNPAAVVTAGAGALVAKGAKKAFGGGKDNKGSSKGKGRSSGGGGGGGGYGGDIGSGSGYSGDTGHGGDVRESNRSVHKNSYLFEYNRNKSKNKNLNPEQQKELQGLVQDLSNIAKSKKGEILNLLKAVEQKEGKDSEGAESLRRLIKSLNMK